MSRQDTIQQILDSGRVGAKGWIRANCPFCLEKRGTDDSRQSFGVNTRTGKYECYRCATWGRLKGFQYEEAREQEESVFGVEKPESFYPLAGDTSMALGPARDYLFRERKVSEDLAATLGIGACTSGRMGGRVVVPIPNPVPGQQFGWLWYVARSWTKKAEVPYLYPQGNKIGLMFNEEVLYQRSERLPVLVVEGVFDAIAHFPHGVAVLGKTTEPHVAKLLLAKRPVVLIPDGDEWESGYAISMRLKLRGVSAGALRLPPRVDPDELPKPLVLEKAREAISSGNLVDII